MLDTIRDHFQPTCPALILPNGTSLPGNLPDDSDRDIEILYIGKLQRRKGIHDLVHAMTFLPDRHLHVVGGNASQIAEIEHLAINFGVADQVNMLEFAIYSVIAPESCSAILWRDQQHAAEAAEALRLTPEHLNKLNLIDEIIPEPTGGAHIDPEAMATRLSTVLENQLRELDPVGVEQLLESRYQKFRNMGAFGE